MTTDFTTEGSARRVPADDASRPEVSGKAVVPRAVLVLAGATRRMGLGEILSRSSLDLPVTAEERVFDLWLKELSALAVALGCERLPVRVLVNDRAPLPESRRSPAGLDISIELDELELRGTAGLLHDVCASYRDDDWVLVVTGGQILTGSLLEPMRLLSGVEGAARLLRYEDDAPAGLMLIRCGALRGIASQGYIDLKEQYLPKLAERERVVAVEHARITLPVRTLSDYIDGLQRYHRDEKSGLDPEPYAEDWRSSFSIIESGAEVDASARLHDSVVLAGGRVSSGAILVRCVVCRGGIVHAGRMQRDVVLGGKQSAGFLKSGGRRIHGR